MRSSVLAGEHYHPPIGLGAEQQMLNVEMLVGLVCKVKVTRSIDKRWDAHGTRADVGVGAAPEHDGIDLDLSLDESLLDEFPEGLLRGRGPGVKEVLVGETLAGIAVNRDPPVFIVDMLNVRWIVGRAPGFRRSCSPHQTCECSHRDEIRHHLQKLVRDG